MRAQVEAGRGLVLTVATGVDDYQARLLQGMRSVFAEREIPLLVHVIDPDIHQFPVSLVNLLRDRRIRGIVTSVASQSEQEQLLMDLVADLDIPRVHVGKEVPGATCIHADNETGMRQLMAHVLDEYGATRPVLVRGAPHQPDSAARERVFREELERRGLAVDEELMITGLFHRDVTYQAMQELLTRRQDMDAVIAANDPSALGAMAALRAEGFQVPEQVAVTGFDNDTAASLTWPGLTTVDQNVESQGEAAARLIISEMTGEAPRPPVVVPSHLVVRGSTARPGQPIATELGAATAMAKAAQSQLITRDAVASVNRALVRCRTLREVVAVLGARLDGLGIDRCFMVMYEDPDDVGEHGDQLARVVLNYRYGCTQTPPGEVFPARLLLPDSLGGELDAGVLIMLPLALSKPALGYVLFELIRGPSVVADVMRIDLGHALRSIACSREQQDEVSRLKGLLVAQRQELTQEITTRQRLEAELRLMAEGTRGPIG